LKDKIRRLELVLWSSVYNYTIHIPNSTESFKLDRQETRATEVCASSLDLVGLNLFSGKASPTALGALRRLKTSVAVVHLPSLVSGWAILLFTISFGWFVY
jgi:hypothetical protein